MPKSDGTGPEGKGTGKGRETGRCKRNSGNENVSQPGRGLGRRRQSGGGRGQEKRLRRGLNE